MVVKKAICTRCIKRFLSAIESPGNATVYSTMSDLSSYGFPYNIVLPETKIDT